MSVQLVAAVRYLIRETVLWLLMAAMLVCVACIWLLPAMRGLFVGVGLVIFAAYQVVSR